MVGGRHMAGYRSVSCLPDELDAATAERSETITSVKAEEEFYQKYNQIIGKLVNMIVNPHPWLLKRGV